jgi:uncharacterized membrane protein
MSGYEVLKFLHVAAVIAWVGGGIGITVLQLRVAAAGDRAGLMSIGRQMETLGKLYYSPLAIVTLVTGVWMVAATPLDFEEIWIVLGIAGIVVSMAIGLGLISPTGRKLLAESQKPEPNFPAIAGYGQRMRVLGMVNLTLLMIVVWAMVTKPGA